MKTKVITYTLFFIMIATMCAQPAFAEDRVEPVFTLDSDMADVAAELLLDGDAYVDSCGSDEASRQKVLRLTQSYVDSVMSLSQTPSVKGFVSHNGQASEQIKLVLVYADDGYTDEETADLSSKAGDTVEAINNFLVSHLSYDDSGDVMTPSSTSATAKGALSTGKAICMGYANAFAVLAERAGIKSVKVRGYTNGEYHVLNVVEGNFAVDVTWNDARNNRYLMIPFDDYCETTGFEPEISVNTAFELKYGFSESSPT